jgi:hypothetical protein
MLEGQDSKITLKLPLNQLIHLTLIIERQEACIRSQAFRVLKLLILAQKGLARP